MTDILEFAVSLAFESGRIQKRHFEKRFGVYHKGEINIVTDVDIECQTHIMERIAREFPDDTVISEEKANKYEGTANRWIIDPIDGTTNYAHGYPFFCTSIGYESGGEVKVGVVYNPISDELFFAQKGKGAYLNGERLSPSGTTDMKQALLVTGFPYDIATNPDNNLDHFTTFLYKAQAIRRDGSAALNLAYVAAGRFDGFWELRLNPWDVAAGTLMVYEAGGRVTDFKGNPYSIYGREILATNGLIHEKMRQVLVEGR
jgi:myo-inositol-1(or 4)-monophosphatase